MLTANCDLLSNGFNAHVANATPAHAPTVVTPILRNLAAIVNQFKTKQKQNAIYD